MKRASLSTLLDIYIYTCNFSLGFFSNYISKILVNSRSSKVASDVYCKLIRQYWKNMGQRFFTRRGIFLFIYYMLL